MVSAERCFCKLVFLYVRIYPWTSGKNQEPIEGLPNNGIFELFFMASLHFYLVGLDVSSLHPPFFPSQEMEKLVFPISSLAFGLV